MKTHLFTTIVMVFVIQAMAIGQTQDNLTEDKSLQQWLTEASNLGLSGAERSEYITSKKKFNIIQSHNHATNQKPANPNPTLSAQAANCTNIDFETGNTQGWTTSCGFHPIWNNQGCCGNPGGQQTIMTGNAADPFGGFPVVAPGGQFSLRLGNNGVGGQADRLEQTFLVSAANANFTYKYAVVFQDPGHTQAQQPAFVIEMFDSLNNAIPCTYYNVSAGQNIPGFVNANNGVVYKPWTDVVVDLTNYIGQNVTIRFTTYDCALGGHFGYAYLDGNCAAFQTTMADTICPGTSKTICAPVGFGSYLWSGNAAVNGQTTQCVTVNTPGNYQVQTTMVTNCQGPTFTYPIYNHPTPNANFNIGNSNNTCHKTVNFHNTSSMSSGTLTSYFWDFGDNTTSTQKDPVHTFQFFGTYTVSLIVGSPYGCYDTTTKVITINPGPLTNISYNPICPNTSVTLYDNSTVTQGNITNWIWNFGNNIVYTTQNPTHTFANSGIYTVTLTVTSNQGCVSTGIHTVIVSPLPNPDFLCNPVCQGQPSLFQNLSSISSGSISNYLWNFNVNQTSTQVNPGFTFPANGNYSVQLTAVSDANCINSIVKTVQVYANPTASFTAPNICQGTNMQFNNYSNAGEGFISSYQWFFGNGNSGGQQSPVVNYPNAGNFNVSLIVTNDKGCFNSIMKTVTVNPAPIVSFSNNTACQNQFTHFSNTSNLNNSNVIAWNWDFENDGIKDDSLSANPVHMYPGYGSFYCKLTAVTDKNCSSTAYNAVIIRPNPVANFTAKSVCLGDKTDFINNTTNPQGNITSYQWQYYGDGNISNIFKNASHTYTFAGVFLVKLEVQNEYGCTNIMSKSVYVHPKPHAQFVSRNPKGCNTICVTFTNQSNIQYGKIATTQWIFGDGSKPAYDFNPTHCFKSGKHTVTLKVVSDSGCIDTYVDHNSVEVYPKPIASFNMEPDELDELEPKLSVTSNAYGANEVQYFINDGSIYLKDNFNHTFTNLDKQKPIIFQVVTSIHGCKDTTSRIPKIKQSYAIYIPNTFTPNYDGLNDGFKAVGFNIKEFKLRIYDRWGELIFETNDMNTAWDGHTNGSNEPIKDDVYVWKANVVDINNKAHELVGHVTLLK
ncbi:MAG: PKD domain-containing protein [Bacteroidia bacterium]